MSDFNVSDYAVVISDTATIDHDYLGDSHDFPAGTTVEILEKFVPMDAGETYYLTAKTLDRSALHMYVAHSDLCTPELYEIREALTPDPWQTYADLEKQALVVTQDGDEVDMVNHPPHYNSHPSGVEVIEITEHMNFTLGNAVKYILRADLKYDAMEDLKKARWYLDREISRRERFPELDAPKS